MKNLNSIFCALAACWLGVYSPGLIHAQNCYETLGSSSNILSVISNRPNQIAVDNDLNTVVFIHRNDISLFGGDNGNLKYDISTDNGATWQPNQGNLNPGSTAGVNGGRYPQATIYNPAGNTDVTQASLVYHAPTVGATWNGYVTGSQLLDGSSSPTENYNQAGVSNTQIPGGLCKGAPGIFWTVDAVYDGYSVISGFRIMKGTYAVGDVSWSVNAELFPDFNTDIYGSAAVGDWNIAFDPTGQKGWVVFLTHLNGLSSYDYHPVFYNTTDGGATWSGPVQLDLYSFPAITALEPTPGCGPEVEITVDMNGNPHAAIGVFKTLYYYSVFGNQPGYLFDFTFDGTTWLANQVAPMSYQSTYFANAGYANNRLQTSRSDDGSKIVFTWVEDFPEDAQSPNLKAVTYDAASGIFCCPRIYSLQCSSVLDGQMYLTTVSPNMIEESGTYTVPVVVGILNSSANPLDPAQYYYLNDLSFSETDFTSPNTSYQPTITVEGGSTVICYGGSITLTANENSSYLWSTGETTQSITVFNSGKYWVVNPDSNFCVSGTNSVQISIMYPPYVYASGPTYLCDGNSVQLYTYTYGGASSNFQWSNGETTQFINVSASGNYSVTVDGCASANSIEVIATDNTYRPVITIDGPSSVCDGETVHLVASESSSYLWSNGETNQAIDAVAYSWGATYTVVNPDSNLCVSSSNSVTLYAKPTPYIYAAPYYELCEGQSTTLYAYPYGATGYLWSTGETEQYITVSSGGSYSVTVDGCVSGPLQIISHPIPANDNICSAQQLTLGTLTPFDNTCATVEPGELSPGAGTGTNSCTSQDGWCAYETGLQNTVWFKFTAPYSGAVSLSCSFDNYWYSTQLALWASDGECNGNLIKIAANDDTNDSIGYYYSSKIYPVYCLDSGRTYYVQIDGYYGTVGSGTVIVNEEPEKKVLVCHKRPRKKDQTIEISICALPAHLAHGDLEGACPSGKTDDASPALSMTEENFNGSYAEAYPNPFTDKATIEFGTEEAADRVTLEIFNVTGQKIATLFEGSMNENEIRKVDFAPSDLSTEMFIYVLRTDSEVSIGKLNLVR